MLDNVATLLRKHLSASSYGRLKYMWWGGVLYPPRKIVSLLATSRPVIRAASKLDESSPLHGLHALNVLAPTRLCRIMTKHGSDKGIGYHNYTTLYSALFSEFQSRPLVLFELGLGTNNPRLASSMGTHGLPGASLRGWREFLPQAQIYGADIDRDILFGEDRIKTFYCDQCDSASIDRLWSEPELSRGADIIVEDGLHVFRANRSFLENSLKHLRPGGFYVTEDIYDSIQQWSELIGDVYQQQYPTYEFVLIKLPSARYPGGHLLVAHRRH